ncbi:hypothetical protein H5410_013507 [Solanum commersonii]|uniref:Uncharacterized protein n=1 Tax=Solanum commersonii TaxID=4109 RepID=A0A9J5ZNI4_SOLCO|nr:hypothetical protein H5410_013507 [Solanum commersonii]
MGQFRGLTSPKGSPSGQKASYRQSLVRNFMMKNKGIAEAQIKWKINSVYNMITSLSTCAIAMVETEYKSENGGEVQRETMVRVVKWEKPSQPLLKLNTDGSALKNPERLVEGNLETIREDDLCICYTSRNRY